MDDARTITLALRGRWHGRYGLAFCPAHANTRTPALSLADGEDGRLLARCFAGCAFADVAAALRGLGHLGRGMSVAPDPVLLAARRAKEAEDRARATGRAKNVWVSTLPAEGSLAERYLRNRAIVGPIPPSLRFAPEAWHVCAKRAPAMVGQVEIGADMSGIHRTWLAEPGRKADLTPAKAMLGPCKGGAVRLTGEDGPLVVAEGIETALSLRDALNGGAMRVWAALSAAGMAGLRLPDPPTELIVAPDGDAPGRKAAETLATRAYARGWQVRVLEAPQGRDWNDLAMEGAE